MPPVSGSTLFTPASCCLELTTHVRAQGGVCGAAEFAAAGRARPDQREIGALSSGIR